MIRVFGHLKKWSKGAVIIDPKCLDHSQFDVADYKTWKEFYPDVEELAPSHDEKPKSLGKKARITIHRDSDHAHDVVTRRSMTGMPLSSND